MPDKSWVLKYGNTATINRRGDVIKKTVKAWLEKGVFERELKALDLVKDFDWSPKVLSVDYEDKSFTMTYVGEPFFPWRKRDYPTDFLDQMKSIIKDMNSVGLRHNDLNKSNITIKDGKMHLIDFGWCSTLDHDFSLGDTDIPNKCAITDVGQEVKDDWDAVMEIWHYRNQCSA